jgi:hypothetical protein
VGSVIEAAGSTGPLALAEPAWWPPDPALAPEPVLPADPFEGWEPVLPDVPAGLWDHLAEVPDVRDLPDGGVPVDPAAVVARVAEGADGCGGPVGLVGAVTELAGIDPQGLDGAARVDLIRGWERVLAMVAGEQQRALASVAAATMGFGLTGMDARHEVGAALRLAPGTAAERTEVALGLTARLGDTLAALRRGEVSWRQAADLAVAVRELPDPLVAAVQARVLPRMAGRTAAESRRAVQAAVVTADPDGAAQRASKAVRGRHIERMGQPDAMGSWWLTMPAQVEGDLWAEVTRRARACRAARRAAGEDVGTGLDALRVDSVIDALLGPGAAARLIHQLDAHDMTDALHTDATDATDAAVLELLRAGVRGRSPYLPRCSCGGRQVAAVVVDLPTALGLAANPGVIPGYGTVPAALARAMAADRDWVRWTTDPGTRQVIDRGAQTYRPAADMTAYLAARDRVCGFPGCSRRAQDCDCDHVVNFARPDGPTVAINLGPLCRQHHNAKTHGRWTLTYDPDTAIKTWTSPLGRTYTTGTDPPLT